MTVWGGGRREEGTEVLEPEALEYELFILLLTHFSLSGG